MFTVEEPKKKLDTARGSAAVSQPGVNPVNDSKFLTQYMFMNRHSDYMLRVMRKDMAYGLRFQKMSAGVDKVTQF